MRPEFRFMQTWSRALSSRTIPLLSSSSHPMYRPAGSTNGLAPANGQLCEVKQKGLCYVVSSRTGMEFSEKSNTEPTLAASTGPSSTNPVILRHPALPPSPRPRTRALRYWPTEYEVPRLRAQVSSIDRALPQNVKWSLDDCSEPRSRSVPKSHGYPSDA